jgi:ribosomal protein L21E
MEVFKKYSNQFVWFSVLMAMIVITGCSSSGGSTSATAIPASSTAFTEYSLAGVSGITNEAAKTIEVTVPNGTDVTALVATFATNGTDVRVGGVVQTSTVTPNNFTAPVAYTVTAAEGTTAIYTVSVRVAAISERTLTSYSLAGASGVINETAKTISVTVPSGTNVTALIATFSTTGSTVKVGTVVQTSGSTANNFTNPVAYIVTAADGSTATYTVTVAVASSTAKAISAYSFAGYTGASGVINETAKTISVTVPSGTNVTALIATFSTTGSTVKVGTVVQTSGSTANNFTNPVAYIVTAADGSTATYTVTVAVASSTAKAISAYSFAGYTGASGVINETAKTISVTVPSGTNVTALIATFSTTGSTVKVGTVVQTSGSTANNFTNPVAYIVTAADGSTATYTVTVAVASSTAKAISAYSFAGYTGASGVINETAKTISVTVPSGTNVTALIATFSTTGSTVKVGTVVQTSGSTANNFTNPVAYIVTAADGSTATYTVTVAVASSTAKAISAYSFAGYTGASGVINETAKTISVTVPSGTNVTALIATFSTTGSTVKVGTVVQTSGSTANNFTNPVAYIVTAADGSTATYTVTVAVASSTAKAISAYSFAALPDSVGVIDEGAKTIAISVLPGTVKTALVSTFTTTGNNVKVGTTVQTSGSTANDFTNPLVYTVTAADASTALYSVTVATGAGPSPVALGTAGNFTILSKAGISTTGTTAIVGDMGVSPIAATSITGFSLSLDPSNTFSTSPLVTGKIYAADYAAPTPANMTTAIGDMEIAYTDAAGRPAAVALPFLNLGMGTLSNQTLAPGIYTWGSGVTIPTNLTFNGGANDVWILQVSGTLGIGSNMQIILAGGAQAKNIFWQVSGSVSLNTGSHFEGILLTATNIAMFTNATINGRLLAQTAVTLDASTITAP